MNSDEIRRYANRPWADVEQSRRRYRERRRAAGESDTALRVSHALWLHMRSVRPSWPSAGDRQEDLAHHVKLVRLFDRASRALADR